MALQVYSSSAVYIGGSLLTENATVTVTRRSGAQIVNTIAKGMAGMSPGARHMEIRIAEAVPASGFEFNPGPNINGLITIPVAIFAAGKTLATTAFITEDDFKHAVNQEAMLDITMICSFADWT